MTEGNFGWLNDFLVGRLVPPVFRPASTPRPSAPNDEPHASPAPSSRRPYLPHDHPKHMDTRDEQMPPSRRTTPPHTLGTTAPLILHTLDFPERADSVPDRILDAINATRGGSGELDLWGLQLDDDELARVITAAAPLGMRVVDGGRTRAGPRATAAIAALLASSSRLRELRLCGAELGDDGAAALFPPAAGPSTTTAAGEYHLPAADAAGTPPALEDGQWKWQCSGGSAGGTGGLRLLMEANGIGDLGAERLCSGLGGGASAGRRRSDPGGKEEEGAVTAVRHDGAGRVEVTALSLASNFVRALSLESISALRRLKELDLRRNLLEDPAVERLAELLERHGCVLEALDVAENRISDAGGRRLGEALRTNRSLGTLKLHGNSIDVECAQVRIGFTHAHARSCVPPCACPLVPLSVK